MSFAAGAATFNSCNKAGSIVQFTDHLRIHPNDYNALMWRAKAYGIVGQPQNALRDIEHAISVSSGVKREIATAQKLSYTTTGLEAYGNHVKQTVKRYPNEWTAWKELGRYDSASGDEEGANQCNMKSLDLAAKYNETRDPEICWINYDVGNHCMSKGNVDTAKGFYEAAIESSPTHTVSHIRLCTCSICQGNLQSARQSFQTAKSLNPNLASQVFNTESFDEYHRRLMQQSMQTSAPTSKLASGNAAGKQTGARAAGGGATGGSGGGGNGSGSDNDDDVSAIWKRLQKESSCIKRYGGHKYVQSKCGKYWYSRDTAGHGGAEFKMYEDTGSTLRFRDSLDAKFRPMTMKHESREGTIIRKSDMIGVK